MPEHLATAKTNESLADALIATDPERATWAVTVLFYAAAHYGRAYVANLGHITHTSHPGFAADFLKLTGERRLYGHYQDLKSESERGRYDCVTYTTRDYEDLKVDHFVPWRDWILAKLPPGRL